MNQLSSKSDVKVADLGIRFLRGFSMLIACVAVGSLGFAMMGALYVLASQMGSQGNEDLVTVMMGFAFLGGVAGAILYALRLPVRIYGEDYAVIAVGIVCIMISAFWFMVVQRMPRSPDWLIHALLFTWLAAMWVMNVADTFKRLQSWKRFIIAHFGSAIIFTLVLAVLFFIYAMNVGRELNEQIFDLIISSGLGFGLLVASSVVILLQRFLHAKWSEM